MQSCGLLVNPNNTWVHVAVSWDRASGVVSFFADGELLFQSERAVEGDLLRPPRAGGVLVIGQEMDAFLGDFDDMQSLDGIVDELRLWVRPLSAEEIQTNMHRVLRVGQHNTTGLHMLWQFDRYRHLLGDASSCMPWIAHAQVGPPHLSPHCSVVPRRIEPG